MRKHIFLVAGLAASAWTAPADAAVTFGDGMGNGASIDVAASVYVYGATASGADSESDYDSAETLPASPLFATASAGKTIVRGGVQASASADESGSATFASAASGRIVFTGATTAASFVPLGAAGGYDDGSNFTYNFSTSTDARFDLSYVLLGAASDYYNGYGYLQDLTSSGETSIYFQDFQPGGGSYSASLIAGHSYLFNIHDTYHDLTQVAGIDSGTGSRSDIYDFKISAVPEPKSWALTIAGFGFAGTRIRRRRVAAIRMARV